jgi:hypothetical protein
MSSTKNHKTVAVHSDWICASASCANTTSASSFETSRGEVDSLRRRGVPEETSGHPPIPMKASAAFLSETAQESCRISRRNDESFL